MPYRRNTRLNGYYNRNTQVSLMWSNTFGMYTLKFMDTHQWDRVKGVIFWIKGTIPGSERDYDPESKTWFVHEKWVDTLKSVIEAIPEFDLVYAAKPEGQVNSVKYIPTDILIGNFKNLTGNDLTGLDYDVAKKTYRKVCLMLHPDRNPNDVSAAEKMSKVNEIWTSLEVQHFKTKVLAEQSV